MASGGYWKRKFDTMDARSQESGSCRRTRKWVWLSLNQIYTSHLWFYYLVPLQVAIGHGYKRIIDMFNGARDLIDANNWKEELLDDGADIDDKDMFDAK